MILSFIAGVAVTSYLYCLIYGGSTVCYCKIGRLTIFHSAKDHSDCEIKQSLGDLVVREERVHGYRTIDIRTDGATPGVEFPGETVYLRHPDGRMEGPVTFRAQHMLIPGCISCSIECWCQQNFEKNTL